MKVAHFASKTGHFPTGMIAERLTRLPLRFSLLEADTPVRVTLDRKKDSQAIQGLCTIVAHEGKHIAYADWKCTGNLKGCEGVFTFTGGGGGFNGISGTTPFQTSIVFEHQEGKTAQAVGYAVWPTLTYTLP